MQTIARRRAITAAIFGLSVALSPSARASAVTSEVTGEVATATVTSSTTTALAEAPITEPTKKPKKAKKDDDERAPILGFTKGKLSLELGGQLFMRVRGTRARGGDWSDDIALNRARLTATFRYGELLRAVIEPDFAGAACSASGAVCSDAELSDVYFDVEPVEAFALRTGQAKSPYGVFETTSEWRLPTQRRGLVSELVTNRLGFGGRRLGLRARVKLSDVALKPSLEAGVYSDVENGGDLDGAARLAARVFKGARVELAGYARANAASDAGYGASSALSFAWDSGPILVLAEAALGRARLLSIDGTASGDSTFVAGRVLASYAIPVGGDGLELEPFFGLDAFDPNSVTKDDLGGAIRGGVGLFFDRVVGCSIELERRAGQSAFVAPNETVVSFFTGVSLE
ncbi:OprO/OprP family phosphate-selective porin [Myxococcota bacterium]|nr:OprO/OprP family phosphate-selective porin [Myxococcota bacterium]